LQEDNTACCAAEDVVRGSKRNFGLKQEEERPGLLFDFPGFSPAGSFQVAPKSKGERDLLQDLDELEGDEVMHLFHSSSA